MQNKNIWSRQKVDKTIEFPYLENLCWDKKCYRFIIKILK